MLAVVACLSLIPAKSVAHLVPRIGSLSAVRVNDAIFVDVLAPPHAPIGGGYPTRRIGAWFLTPTVLDSRRVDCGGSVLPRRLAKLEYRDATLQVRNEYLFPHEVIPFLDGSDFMDRAVELAYGKGMNRNLLWNRYWVDTTLLLFPKHRKPDFEPPPLVDSGFPNQEQTRYDYAHRLTRFHFTMLSRDTVKLFHVLGEQLYVSQELAVMDWQKTLPKPPKPPPRELRTGTLPKELLGSVFAVYRDRNRDYLVTDKGTVYSVTPEGKDKVAIQPVWQDPKRWVFGVYSDKDGAVYGFGYDGPLHDRNRFYFRLDAKPVAVRYRFAAKLTNDLGDDSLREAFECGRALWKAQQKNEKK